MTLQGKIIWITGASSGIGEALAIYASKFKTQLILSARNVSALNEVKAKCESFDSKVHIVPLDLADESSISNAFEIVKSLDLLPDVLINNGGISQRSKALETPVDIHRKILEVNYFAAVNLTQKVGALMLEKGGGAIAFTSSTVGKVGVPLRSAYSASKHALHGYADALRAEYSKNGISVTVVCPGRVKTNVSINAVTASGEKHGKMDEGQAKGMSSEQCAKLYWKAILTKKEELYMGFGESTLIYIRRFFPKLFYYLIQRIKIQ